MWSLLPSMKKVLMIYIGFSGEATTYVLRVATEARSRALGPLHPSFDLVTSLRRGLNSFLPDNAHETATGRLHVSLTRVTDRENVIVNTFDTKEDLIQVAITSQIRVRYFGTNESKEI